MHTWSSDWKRVIIIIVIIISASDASVPTPLPDMAAQPYHDSLSVIGLAEHSFTTLWPL